MLVLAYNIDTSVLFLSSFHFPLAFLEEPPHTRLCRCSLSEWGISSQSPIFLQCRIISWFPAQSVRHSFLIILSHIASGGLLYTLGAFVATSSPKQADDVRSKLDIARHCSRGIFWLWPFSRHDAPFQPFLRAGCCRSLHDFHIGVVFDVTEVLRYRRPFGLRTVPSSQHIRPAISGIRRLMERQQIRRGAGQDLDGPALFNGKITTREIKGETSVSDRT